MIILQTVVSVHKPDPLVHELFEMERMFTNDSRLSKRFWYMGRQAGVLENIKTANFKDVRP